MVRSNSRSAARDARLLVSWGALLGLASFLAACGRSATEQDCEQILEKAARLEMEARLGKPDEKLVATEVAETKKSMRDAMMSQCVGKRITDGALECVKNAKTSKELTEDCFR
jgi:hypothetical protein